MSLNIDIYLKNAFQELDAFSLPSIGTFRKVHLSAQLDDENQRIHPPKVEVEFSPTVDTQVSLVKYLVQQINMPQAEAEEIVKDIQTEILGVLKKQSRFDLPEIGFLHQDQEGRLFFVSKEEDQNLFAGEYFGLTALDIPRPTVDSPAVMSDENIQHMASTATPTPPSTQPNRGLRVGLIGIFALLILGTVGYIYMNYQGKSIKRLARAIPGQPQDDIRTIAPSEEQLFADNQMPTSEDPASATVPSSTSDADLPEQSGNNAVAQADEESFQEREVSTPETAGPEATNPVARVASPETRTRSTSSMGLPRGDEKDSATGNLSALDTNPNARVSGIKYHLIAGSFSQYEKATRFVRQLDAQGYPGAQILDPEPGKQNYRVSIYTSTDRTKVSSFKTQQEKLGQKTAWIYEEKLP
ncbi:MAG: SPOR domain-containing protein [Bacteroidota bacterium]